jgi:hypothetical protein
MKAVVRISAGGRPALALICAIAAAAVLSGWWGGGAPGARRAPTIESSAPVGPVVPIAEAAAADPGAAVPAAVGAALVWALAGADWNTIPTGEAAAATKKASAAYVMNFGFIGVLSRKSGS